MKYIYLIALLTLYLSCTNSESEKQIESLNTQLEKVKEDLNVCASELENIKNTPENRSIRAKKFLSENNLQAARVEFSGIVDNFKGTSHEIIASEEIAKIDKIIEQKSVEAERKKALGYKILKPTSKVKYDDILVSFDKIWSGKRWSFDDYGHQYFLRDAQRGNTHVLARVSISSENKNPSLPAVLVYQMIGGELKHLGTLGYEFRRWKDYGSYLGNTADYGNDFAHSKTIPFNLGLQVSNDELKKGPVYIVLKKYGCFNRHNKDYGNPEIHYVQSNCDAKYSLKVEDFDNDYVLLKIL